MKRIFFLFLTISIFSLTSCNNKKLEPLDVAKKIFGKDNFSDIDKYITGDYKGKPNGQDIQKESTVKFSLLEQRDKKAVVVMTILDSKGNGIDSYLYFEKSSEWKMNAYRVMAMPGLFNQLKVTLEQMTPQDVDKVIEFSNKQENSKFAMFTSRDEYNFKLGNAKLTLELDDNIVKHFLKNKIEFERIKNLALKQLEITKTDEEMSIMLVENLKVEYQKLFISSISTGGYELGKCINFLIGGMIDNSVGYIFVKDKKDLPEMNPNKIIMIREIGNGWYMYKTT